MVSADKDMVAYCFDTLLAHYTTEQPPPPAFDDGQHPLFVTWKKVVNGGEPRLRGCIGTLEPRGLINGFRDYALTSALKDRRFSPIQAKEIPQLECTVSILTDYETASHYLDWEIGKHGIIIEFTDPDYNTRRSATYLPEVAAHEGGHSTTIHGKNQTNDFVSAAVYIFLSKGWTKTEAIDSLMRKSGYNGSITEPLRKSIRLTRYQSSLCTMDHNDYVSYVKETRGGAPSLVGAISGSR